MSKASTHSDIGKLRGMLNIKPALYKCKDKATRTRQHKECDFGKDFPECRCPLVIGRSV